MKFFCSPVAALLVFSLTAYAKSPRLEIVDRASVESTLRNPSSPYYSWVRDTANFNIRVNGSSGVLLSPGGGAQIFVSAYHVLGPAPLIDQDDVPFEVGLLKGRPMNLPQFKSREYYPVFLPGLFEREWEQNYRNLRPANDFFLGRIEAAVNPRGLAFGAAETGEQVIVLGFPDARGGQASYSIGQVLSRESSQAIYDSDPTESAARFEFESEFIVSAPASGGMSGGGVFDRSGRLLGLITRGVGDTYTRVVRITHIRDQINLKSEQTPLALRNEFGAVFGAKYPSCGRIF